jgi:hypothetical protein
VEKALTRIGFCLIPMVATALSIGLASVALMHPAVAGESNVTTQDRTFADIVQRWNGKYLWAPATASDNIITRFGDEARAVFGPIPDADCNDPAAKTLTLEIDGNIVDLKPNPAKPGNPLEFEHRNVWGDIVKWTHSIARCDKPSLAGSVTFCGMNSRLNRVVKGNIEWLFFCRKSTSNMEIDPEPYWQKSNPKFARLGTIGFNGRTGEIVFFDGRKDRGEFDWSQKFIAPGGHSYSDRDGRKAAEQLYDPTFQVQCSACHDNKNAYVVSPHMQLARVGYPTGAKGREAAAFSLGDYLPKMPRRESMPFRVIGSGYTDTYKVELGQAKTVRDPTGNCTECHTLTTQVTGQRLAADAAGLPPEIANPTWAQLLQVKAERAKLSEIASRRTDWAKRSGPGKIHPWMLPVFGNDVAASTNEISPADWGILSNCLWGAGGKECGYRPLYTACPAPGSIVSGDSSEPKDMALSTLPVPPGEKGADRVLRLSWKYLNSFGGVPQRDDVRFDVAIRSVPISRSGAAPSGGDYPTLDEVKGKEFISVWPNVGTSGGATLVRNISYFGHAKFTEPAPNTDLRNFRLDLPGQCGRRYLVRLLPKRLCFDQSHVAYAERRLQLFADIPCN